MSDAPGGGPKNVQPGASSDLIAIGEACNVRSLMMSSMLVDFQFQCNEESRYSGHIVEELRMHGTCWRNGLRLKIRKRSYLFNTSASIVYPIHLSDPPIRIQHNP